MTNIAELTAQNAQRWRAAKCKQDFSGVARRLLAGKPRYLAVQAKTGVPWFIIAVIHEREASGRWTAQLGQGDPLDRVSTHVPKGRGPFPTWEAGAEDALVECPPYAARWKDWSAGGALTLLEQYNGLGYAAKGLPSPYIWSGTNQYEHGKYVADHQFDPNAVDRQLGCAGLLMAMRALDPSIRFADEAMSPPDVHPVEPKKSPPLTPQITTIFGSIAAAVAHYFGLPLWGVVSAAFIVAAAIFLIFKSRSK